MFTSTNLEQICKSPRHEYTFCITRFIDSVPDMASSDQGFPASDNQDWLMLSHPVIFDKIMLMIGLDSLESLDSCSQVCRSWNAMIMKKIWENPTKKWGTIIQRRIKRSWDIQGYYPSYKLISRAKMLGKHKIKIFFIYSNFCFRRERNPPPRRT